MSQKTDSLIKLALVFFVSLLSFSIGTYVGKKYSDNQHKLAILEPKKETTHEAQAAEEFATETSAHSDKTVPANHASELTATESKPAALTDSEVAKIAEEFASDQESSEEKIVASIESNEKVVGKISNQTKSVEKVHTRVVAESHAEPKKATVATLPKATEEHDVTEITKPVQKVVEKTAATELVQQQKRLLAKVKTDHNTEDTIMPTPTDGESVREPASIPARQELVPIHYTVQIGSYPTESEADQMTKKLQNKGYKTSFVPAKVNGQIWYRVNVGLFGTIKEAQDYKKEFLEKTNLSSAIVQRVQR